MKQVLLIDESSVFRDYLKHKLETENVALEIGLGQLDIISKIRTTVPDLIVMDFNTSRSFIYDVLEAKKTDLNAKDVPVLILAQKIEKEELVRLGSYGIKKIIPKPLRIDQFFSFLNPVLATTFDIDSTPCILEARVNDNIIFIEIAQGLNREKIGLLKYKIRELITLYNLTAPKILVMMTDLSLSFIDGPNLELLMASVMADPSIKNRNIKILTFDKFATQFLDGTKEYADIQIVRDLSKALDSLLKDVGTEKDASTVISERILVSKAGSIEQESTLEMRFKSELEVFKSTAKDIRIAVVDDDIVIRTVLAKTFTAIQASVDQFETGNLFLPKGLSGSYDLIFLDLMMPGINGFEVLKELQKNGITTPVIVLSAVSQKEAVMKVLSAGVKSYMIKPLKPDAILKKAIEVLHAAL